IGGSFLSSGGSVLGIASFGVMTGVGASVAGGASGGSAAGGGSAGGGGAGACASARAAASSTAIQARDVDKPPKSIRGEGVFGLIEVGSLGKKKGTKCHETMRWLPTTRVA